MKLFIANCTLQRHEFLYRQPEQKRMEFVTQVIDIGSQVQIWKDAPSNELKAIIAQHESYGLVPVNEIDRTKTFVGLCYSFDKPIDVEKIMYTVEANSGVLEAGALEMRKEAAQVISHSLSAVAQEAGNSLNSLEVEVKELPRPGHDAKVHETITVERAGGRRRSR